MHSPPIAVPGHSVARTWRARLAGGAIGTALAIGSLAFELELARDLRVSLVPAALMTVMLLGGWTLAAASAVCVSIAAVFLHQGPLQTFLIAAVAVMCAQMLRRGTPPQLAAVVQLAPALLFGHVVLQHGAPALAAFETLGSAAVNAAFNVALATSVLIFMPQRSPHLPSRCRVRWNHIAFALLLGTVCVVSMALLAETNHDWPALSGYDTWSDAPATRLRLLVVVAFAASFMLASRLETATGRWSDRLRNSRASALPREALPGDALPLEVTGLFLKTARETSRARRDAARHLENLAAAHQTSERLRNELRTSQDALDRKTAQLGRALRIHARTRARYRALMRLRERGHTSATPATPEPGKGRSEPAHHPRNLCVASLSHELRTPLQGLIAALDMLEVDGPAESRRWLSIARSSAHTLLRIANDVLDFTRMDSGHFRLDRQPFCLTGVLEEIAAEFRARAELSGLSVTTHLTPPLPRTFLGDSVRLKQILGNLISNALRFTRHGGVTLAARYDGNLCIIDVIDTGEGIPPEMRESIFDPFVQAGSSSRRHAGAGLGLPISRNLAEAMGGTLTLLQTNETGSTFRLALALEPSGQAQPDEPTQPDFTHPRGRVLVVEDNSVSRCVTEALLTSLECPAVFVESGAEALAVLGRQSFDLILMDCQMPGLDGYETTRQARQLTGTRVPIIAMTASAMEKDRSRCLEAGMDDFLPKPFGRRALSELLGKWLNAAGAARSGRDLEEALAALPALDERVFDDLRESLQCRREPLERIGSAFVSSAEELLRLFDKSAGTDPHALAKHLHALLGSAGMVGARQVEYLAGKLETLAESSQLEEAPPVTSMLRQAMWRFDRHFAARLDGVTTGRHASL